MKKEIKKAQRGLLIAPPGWKQKQSADEYYTKLANVKSEEFEKSRTQSKKSSAPKKQVVKREKIESIKAPERKAPQMKMPTTKGIQKGPETRKYSDSEKKMLVQLDKVKKGEGVESAQTKLKALQAKRVSEKMKTERIEKRADNKITRIKNRTENKIGRVAKRAAVGMAKANVKAVKKSFKK